jgi:hypothetical protein
MLRAWPATGFPFHQPGQGKRRRRGNMTCLKKPNREEAKLCIDV